MPHIFYYRKMFKMLNNLNYVLVKVQGINFIHIIYLRHTKPFSFNWKNSAGIYQKNWFIKITSQWKKHNNCSPKKKVPVIKSPESELECSDARTNRKSRSNFNWSSIKNRMTIKRVFFLHSWNHKTKQKIIWTNWL